MSENNQLETEVGKDKVESSNETRGNAMRVFAGNVNRFNQYGSVRKFRAYCHDVALQVTSQSTDGIDSTAAFLCQRYSRETLKDMFPDLKRYGIAFDYGDADVVKIQKASEIINNRTKGKISKQMIIEIAKLVKSGNIKYSTERDIRTSDRFRIASGRCGVVSGEIKELVEDDRYGDFDVEMLHINMPSTPLKRSPYIRQHNEHNLVGIAFQDETEGDVKENMILIVDPTVAQMENGKADIEFASITGSLVDDYLTQRYGAFPLPVSAVTHDGKVRLDKQLLDQVEIEEIGVK